MRILTLFLMLAACGSNTPSHLPNPLALPGLAVSNGIENAIYGARRNRVARYVQANHAAIRAEINIGTGAHLTQAMNLARINLERHLELVAELQSHPEIYQTNDPEPLVVAFMVYGN